MHHNHIRHQLRSLSTLSGPGVKLSYQAWPSSQYPLHCSVPNSRKHAPPVVFLHGLFGSKQNVRTISKNLAAALNTKVYAIDLRNHGDSPHIYPHTYEAMSSDIKQFIDSLGLEKPCLIGHSMGAKTAMTIALQSPGFLSSLISVDNSPTEANLGSSFSKYISAMKHIEEADVSKQKEADSILERYEKVPSIRQFLLTNLVRSKDGYLRFRVALDILGASLNDVSSFPFKISDNRKFYGPALFIRGTRSSYVKPEDFPVINHFFPYSKIEDIDTGHWVMFENPSEFQKAVIGFLT